MMALRRFNDWLTKTGADVYTKPLLRFLLFFIGAFFLIAVGLSYPIGPTCARIKPFVNTLLA